MLGQKHQVQIAFSEKGFRVVSFDTSYPVSVLARAAYASVAKTVILPMQDVLGLNEKARMNTPASIKNNWLWRLKPNVWTRAKEAEVGDLIQSDP